MIVSDLMTKPPTVVRASATLADAARIMLEQHVSGLPVQNEAGDLVGIITEGDLLRRPELGTENKERKWIQALIGPGRSMEDYMRTHGRHVDEVMTRRVVTVAPDTPLAEAAELMHKRHIKCLPVVELGKLVGIMSRSDFLKALISELTAADSNKPTEETIRAHIIDTLMRENWAPKSGITVEVTGGTVTLKGTVVSDVERRALLVVAENAPGVKEVHDNLVREDSGDSVGF